MDCPCLVRCELCGVMGGIGAEFLGTADSFISPLGELTPDCDFDRFQITVTEPVTMTGQAVVFTGDAMDKPSVTSLQDDSNGLHTVVLDRKLEPGDWAKITLTVESKATGCLGTLVMWVAHHPDNINQDGVVNILDATAFGVEFSGSMRKVLVDLNCDGFVDVRDATTFGHEWNGTGDATQAWQGHILPAKP